MARILLVDDDDLFRNMLRLTLAKMGHEVREARNGKEALKRLEEKPPDVVLTDIIMPEKEGLATIAELRRSHPEVKIVAMSGGGRINRLDYLQMAKMMGAARVLPKPFSDEEVAAVLRELLPPPA